MHFFSLVQAAANEQNEMNASKVKPRPLCLWLWRSGNWILDDEDSYEYWEIMYDLTASSSIFQAPIPVVTKMWNGEASRGSQAGTRIKTSPSRRSGVEYPVVRYQGADPLLARGSIR